MNKRKFVFTLTGIITLIIITSVLDKIFETQTERFGFSSGFLFLSTIFLYCYKEALKPPKKFGEIDRTKWYYAKKGKLYKYHKLCKNLFIITSGTGIIALIVGLIEVLFV